MKIFMTLACLLFFIGCTKNIADGGYKPSPSGPHLKWERVYGGADYDYGRQIAATSDGGFLLMGDTESKGAGRSDLWLLKFGW